MGQVFQVIKDAIVNVMERYVWCNGCLKRKEAAKPAQMGSHLF